jgi:Ulp1 family protease
LVEHVESLINYIKSIKLTINFDVIYEACPKQKNYTDCGVFVLYFADYLVHNIPLCFTQEEIINYSWRTQIGIRILKNMKQVSIFK